LHFWRSVPERSHLFCASERYKTAHQLIRGGSQTMKKLLLGLAATTALITPVLAADLPAPNSPVYYKAPPPPVFSWSGCYIGADVGGGFVRDSDHEHTAAGGASPFSPAPTNTANPGGVIGGGYLGCNYQFSSHVVIGAEGDGQFAGIRGGTAQFPGSAPPGLPNDFYETRSNAQGSIRGRLGYGFDRVLLYATGGVSFAQITEHDVQGFGPLAGTFNDTSTTRTGWTVGGGLEYAFLNNLIGRVEYRYSDFGTFSYSPPIFAPFVENHRITENQVLVGLSYKFGGGPMGAW
jgi:outer membrane immunogenic protein